LQEGFRRRAGGEGRARVDGAYLHCHVAGQAGGLGLQELLDDSAQGVDILPAGRGSGLRGCERGGPEKQGGEERAFHDG